MKTHATPKVAVKLQRLADAEADYRAGELSVSSVARKHSLAESTLRREARRFGWTRASPEARRHVVAEALSGAKMAGDLTDEKVRQIQAAAAAQDVIDMNSGLLVARSSLIRLLSMVDMVDDPRDIKIIVDANRAAIETIRIIRSLDVDKQPQAPSVSIDINTGFAELRAAFAKRLGHTLSN